MSTIIHVFEFLLIICRNCPEVYTWIRSYCPSVCQSQWGNESSTGLEYSNFTIVAPSGTFLSQERVETLVRDLANRWHVSYEFRLSDSYCFGSRVLIFLTFEITMWKHFEYATLKRHHTVCHHQNATWDTLRSLKNLCFLSVHPVAKYFYLKGKK